jgi:hypothetical protein
MAEPSKTRAAIKFGFWTLAAALLVTMIVQAFVSGKMASWFYHTAGNDGYAINADTFKSATRDKPAILQVGQLDRIEGLVAVPVKKGDRLPANCNGIISSEILKKGKRAKLDGNTVTVMVPWEIQDAKGFKFKDTFKHKGIETDPWAAVWNVAMVLALGLALGLMAEGFTDLLGMKLEKIRHFEGH